MSFIAKKNSGRWWGSLVEYALIAFMVPVPLLIAYGALGGFARAQGIDTEAGNARCQPWHKFLLDHQDERVVFTGEDEDGLKVKVLAKQDGTTWRFAILAAADDAKLGCVVFQGTKWIGSKAP